jgi:hypothetical protein
MSIPFGMDTKFAAANHRGSRQQVSKVSTIGGGVNSAAPTPAVSAPLAA